MFQASWFGVLFLIISFAAVFVHRLRKKLGIWMDFVKTKKPGGQFCWRLGWMDQSALSPGACCSLKTWRMLVVSNSSWVA